MKVLEANIEELDWEFPAESKLVKYSEYTSPKDIFHALCDEIGKYYQSYEFKYIRSRPRLTYKTNEFDIEIAFWSSRSNMAGQHINLEIIGHAYSKKLSVLDKENENASKGFLLSHTDFWEKLNYTKPKGTITVYLLDGTIVSEKIEDTQYAIDKYNCNYNIYGISTDNFKNILKYINTIFLKQIDGLTIKEKMIEFISSIVPGKKLGRENSRFLKYIELTFGNDKIILDLLREKNIKIQ